MLTGYPFNHILDLCALLTGQAIANEDGEENENAEKEEGEKGKAKKIKKGRKVTKSALETGDNTVKDGQFMEFHKIVTNRSLANVAPVLTELKKSALETEDNTVKDGQFMEFHKIVTNRSLANVPVASALTELTKSALETEDNTVKDGQFMEFHKIVANRSLANVAPALTEPSEFGLEPTNPLSQSSGQMDTDQTSDGDVSFMSKKSLSSNPSTRSLNLIDDSDDEDLTCTASVYFHISWFCPDFSY
jgi:hypothetical protein